MAKPQRHLKSARQKQVFWRNIGCRLNTNQKNWFKPVSILLTLLFASIFLPPGPVDPWGLFGLKKIVTIIFALTFIQVMSSITIQFLGSRAGVIVTGYLGGLISSTATTASLARRSKISTTNGVTLELLSFLSATLAMLFEGLTIILFGTRDFHSVLSIILLGPIFATVLMILFISKKQSAGYIKIDSANFKIMPILKLSVFIISILALSKILQKLVGQSGLFILTFVVSLFEIHGSLVANVQLHDAGAFDVRVLGASLAISVVASYISKVFLIFSMGSSALAKQALKYTALLFLSLFAGWAFFLFCL